MSWRDQNQQTITTIKKSLNTYNILRPINRYDSFSSWFFRFLFLWFLSFESKINFSSDLLLYPKTDFFHNIFPPFCCVIYFSWIYDLEKIKQHFHFSHQNSWMQRVQWYKYEHVLKHWYQQIFWRQIFCQ